MQSVGMAEGATQDPKFSITYTEGDPKAISKTLASYFKKATIQINIEGKIHRLTGADVVLDKDNGRVNYVGGEWEQVG